MWTHPKQCAILEADAVLVTCQKCGNDVWEVRGRTGTGKLPSNQLKLKCRKCGLWFIVNKERLGTVFGEVHDPREGTGSIPN